MQVNGPGFGPGAAGAGRGAAPKQSSPDPTAETTVVSGGDKLRPAHGVLRLLQEGHFKGVADVRLRINFADELAALQVQATGARTQRGPESILEPVDAVIEEFVAQEGFDADLATQIEEAADAFREAVRGFLDAFDPAADPAGSELSTALEDAFQSFVEALQALAPETEPAEATETVEETLPAVEGEVPPPEGLAFGEFIERLGVAFETAIAELSEAFQSAQILPEVSGPTGNGSAYAKFLDILNGLNGGGGDSETTGLDTAA